MCHTGESTQQPLKDGHIHELAIFSQMSGVSIGQSYELGGYITFARDRHEGEVRVLHTECDFKE